MSILVLAECNNGKFRKSAFEAVHYGHLCAKLFDTECVAAILGSADNPSQLGIYGANKIVHVNSTALDHLDSQMYTNVLAKLASENNAHTIILCHTSLGKTIVGRLAVKLNAGSVTGVNQVPTKIDGGLAVQKFVFSSKALANYEIKSSNRVLTLMGNSVPPVEIGSPVAATEVAIDLDEPKVKVKELKTVTGTVPLPEAELVVSAGRGMKGPENWGIIEELADVLGATTACSRPVADSDWRPHHEHVGQTGVAIRPNLYIAVGISGAIQHLAGVNNSKVIVVINKDPEAPFFKAADYGVCADLFDVVPDLITAVKKLKEGN
jgi:electron transfer flavoprotein alpha subunit